jgi:hypothetical protein
VRTVSTRALIILAASLVAVAGCSPRDTGEAVPSAEPAGAVGPAREESAAPAVPAGAPTPLVSTEMTAAIPFGDDALLAGLAPAGWSQVGEIEHYNVASLYDKIDGRSELYMSYDVRGLSWSSYVKDGDSSRFIDVFVYDMRSPTNAFGIYSVEREVDQPAVDVGREGYRTGSNYYFWKGNHYAYVNSSHVSDEATAAGLALANGVASRLADDGGPVLGQDWLPREGLIEDSVQYFKVDAMAMDFMTETFTGQYRWGETPAKAFITKRASEDDAVAVLREYHKYLADYGDEVERFDVDGVEEAEADLGGGFYDAVFRLGDTVAGITALQGADPAKTAAVKLLTLLKAS